MGYYPDHLWVRGASHREDVVDDLREDLREGLVIAIPALPIACILHLEKPHGKVRLRVGNIALVVDVNIATVGVLVLVLRPEVGATQLEPKW